MPRRHSMIDPSRDPAAAEAIAAFEAAERAGLSLFDCYRAGVDAWRRIHPDQATKYSARHAVAVILKAKVRLGLPD